MRKYFYRNKLFIVLAVCFDSTVGLIAAVFTRWKKAPLAPRNIAVIALNHIGDMIMVTPLLANLKTRYPKAKITVICSSVSRGVIENNPHVDDIKELDWVLWYRRAHSGGPRGPRALFDLLRKGEFDFAIDTKGDPLLILSMAMAGVKYRIGFGNGGAGGFLHRAVVFDFSIHNSLALLKLLSDRLDTDFSYEQTNGYSFTKRPSISYELYLRETGLGLPESYAVIHPRAGYASKLWDDGRWEKVINYLIKTKKLSVVVAGGNDVDDFYDRLREKFASGLYRVPKNLNATMLAIKQAKLFIGLDSALAHMAGAFKTPAVILFSLVNNPRRWRPLGLNGKLLTGAVDCADCQRRNCPFDNKCMMRIKAIDVISAINQTEYA